MSLRDLKRTSGHVAPVTPIGTWRYYGPGELARCPVSACGRGLMQAGLGTTVALRVAVEGIGEEGEPSAFLLCPDGRCRARVQVRLLRTDAESGRR